MMNCYKKFFRRLASVALSAIASIAIFSACTEVNDALGENLIPENQRMKIFIDTLGSVKTYNTQTDSLQSTIVGSSYAYIGQLQNDTFGLRRCSFIGQMLPTGLPYTEGFGLDPILDSVLFTYSISDYKGDTTAAQKFIVYEVNKEFIPEDTTFYINFDAEGYINPEPLFTFEITSPTKTASRVNLTAKGREYINRLMTTDTTIYYNDTLWINKFKGLYVAPEQSDRLSKVIYRTETSYTGLQLWMRDHDSIDHDLIYDTISASYAFYAQKAKVGNVAANMVEHDYEGSIVGRSGLNDTLPGDPTQKIIYVEGMGGVNGYLKITDEFIEELAVLGDPDKNGGYENVSINQAMVYIPLTVNVDDPAERPAAIPYLDAAPARMGMYLDMKQIVGIDDYDYEYEASLYDNYGSDYRLPFGGDLNRSRGRYAMDITVYTQRLWSEYRNADGDLSQIKDRSIFIAPAIKELFTLGQVALRGDESVQVVLTYTLMR